MLTHCGPAATYGVGDLDQRWLSQWLFAEWHQAIIQTYVDLTPKDILTFTRVNIYGND